LLWKNDQKYNVACTIIIHKPCWILLYNSAICDDVLLSISSTCVKNLRSISWLIAHIIWQQCLNYTTQHQYCLFVKSQFEFYLHRYTYIFSIHHCYRMEPPLLYSPVITVIQKWLISCWIREPISRLKIR